MYFKVKNQKKLFLFFDELFQNGKMFFESFTAFWGYAVDGVGFATDEAFFTADIALVFECAGVAGEVAVGQFKKLL